MRRARGGKLRLEVWDTGIGIPADKQKAVFREFERLDAGIGEAPGLGLGLSIVERMARVLGHTVTLGSKPRKGSVFAVTAPLAAPPPQTPFVAGAPATATRQSPLADMVVVAIDNDPQIAEGMRALLAAWGCKPIVARSQREAKVELAREKRVPDAIFADFHLDEGDGVDAIVALRWKFGSQPAGGADHRRPFRRDATARLREGRDGDQQALEAGDLAGAAGAMARRRAWSSQGRGGGRARRDLITRK